ncbi:hypothetical protein [Moraxella bovis]|uniref:hypothetical protein n=1 Tax=Moraxella bovis TaxID=476 RepID=UPI00227AA08E|nr:hypothetical protein [Moraxella bovis]WAJ74550.1 hypothetical protein LP095_05210 [Moraxella bovis]WAJ74803.1 hypothetical protein LP095_06570 [Moraxella bovis]
MTTHKLRRELATPKLTATVGEFILKTAMIGLVALLSLRGCDIALKKQAQADYEQCLSWQADGYPVKCDVEKYK